LQKPFSSPFNFDCSILPASSTIGKALLGSMMQRDFNALGTAPSSAPFDLAIIGGGATGAAIALDASLRGFRVALIDKADFGGATTAGSTKLMHGGLRYLANGEFKLVREGLRERRHWSRIAKHLVHPLPFVLPCYSQQKPSRLTLGLGLSLYDGLAFDRNRGVDPMQKMPGYRAMTAAQTLGLVPDLPLQLDAPNGDTPQQNAKATPKLTAGLLYHDGQMLSPERLCLAMIRSAIAAGAVAVNYAEACDFIIEDNRLVGIEVKDGLSRQSVRLMASLTINAAGPWADELMRAGDTQPPQKKLVRSKGIHIVTRNLTRGAALAMPIGDEHLFITPYMGMSVLATTDTKFDAAPDKARVTKSDIEMLLAKANRALPAAKLTPKDVVFSYVGLRPLVADMDDKSDATYGLSRGSEIYDHSQSGGVVGLISALGGKWTSARRLAEQVVDLAMRKLDAKTVACRSHVTTLECAPRDDLGRFMDEMRARFDSFDTASIDLMSRLYGRLLPRMMAANARGLSGLKDKLLARRVAFAVSDEMALTLEDIVLRRLVEGQIGGLSTKQIELIADWLQARLGHSEIEMRRQRKELAAKLKQPV
jgi:glycerol-3-phosphate dehydrogenase